MKCAPTLDQAECKRVIFSPMATLHWLNLEYEEQRSQFCGVVVTKVPRGRLGRVTLSKDGSLTCGRILVRQC